MKEYSIAHASPRIQAQSGNSGNTEQGQRKITLAPNRTIPEFEPIGDLAVQISVPPCGRCQVRK
jgi:hypothetical protein